MGKRPKAEKKRSAEETALPEIEIITKPEANTELLSEKNREPVTPVTVTPKEVLPAVGSDMTTVAKNYRVADIQKALNNAGFNCGNVDGKLGPKTKQAIKDFQKANGLTADGIVGPKTWEKLSPHLNTQDTAKSGN